MVMMLHHKTGHAQCVIIPTGGKKKVIVFLQLYGTVTKHRSTLQGQGVRDSAQHIRGHYPVYVGTVTLPSTYGDIAQYIREHCPVHVGTVTLPSTYVGHCPVHVRTVTLPSTCGDSHFAQHIQGHCPVHVRTVTLPSTYGDIAQYMWEQSLCPVHTGTLPSTCRDNDSAHHHIRDSNSPFSCLSTGENGCLMSHMCAILSNPPER